MPQRWSILEQQVPGKKDSLKWESNQGPLSSESTLQNRPYPSFYRDQLKAHPNLCMTLVIETSDVIAIDRNDAADTSGMIHRLQIDQEYLLRR